MDAPLVSLTNVTTEFRTEAGAIRAIDGVSFDVYAGKTLGVVGESGCGKSVTALSIMQLLPKGIGQITRGEIQLQGRNLVGMPEAELRTLRGNRMAMIFQEPMTSLNPVFTIGAQIIEAIVMHTRVDKRTARTQAIAALQQVGIPAPETRVDDYPHQLSGGMRQRVMIAMALACRPALLIADEPTTALDVTISAQILELLRALQAQHGMGMLLITHDLGVVARTCDEVVVMYAGRIVEKASARDLFRSPQHHYTKGLLLSMPRQQLPSDAPTPQAAPSANQPAHSGSRKRPRLPEIPGMVPSLAALPPGCAFAPRCAAAQAKCHEAMPTLEAITPTHAVRCWFPTTTPEGGAL